MTDRRLLTVAFAVVAFALLCPVRARAAGALDALAQEVVKSLGSGSPGALIIAAPLATDQETPKGDALVLRVAGLIAGKMGPAARVHPQPVQLATARAVAGRAGALVYVQAAISKGDLRVTADLFRSMVNAWDRIRDPLPPPASHAFATTKIDAEVRAFLPPLVLEQATVHRARHDEGDVLAAACGDVDGDGGDELVLVTRARVALGRVKGGRFVAERTASWSALARRLPVPMRVALAGATVGLGTIDVGTTDRGGVSLTPELLGRSPLAGLPAEGGDGPVCLKPESSAGAFDGAPVDCTPSRDARPAMAVPAPRFDAFAAAEVRDASGEAHAVVAVREPSGRLRIKVGDAQHAPEGTFGAQLAVGDLDQDGSPDIATTVDGQDDAINVFSWPSGATELRGRLHLAVPGGVRALAFCPPEQDGEPVLVAVVGSELWLVRAGLHPATAASPEAGLRGAAP